MFHVKDVGLQLARLVTIVSPLVTAGRSIVSKRGLVLEVS